MIYVYVWGSWKRYWPWKIKKNGLDFNKKASNYMPPKSCHFSDKATVMECRKIWVPAMLVWKPCTFCYWLYWTANDKQLRPLSPDLGGGFTVSGITPNFYVLRVSDIMRSTLHQRTSHDRLFGLNFWHNGAASQFIFSKQCTRFKHHVNSNLLF